MSERTQKRAARLRQIELLLLHPVGFTQAEIARKFGVQRSTALRDLATLQDNPELGVIQDGNRYRIDPLRYRFAVRLNVHESMALHLATRLMATSTDRHDLHAASAMRAVATSLESHAPIVSRQIRRSAGDMESEGRRREDAYTEHLERLTTAMSRGLALKLHYRTHAQQYRLFTFEPYCLEPYAVGRSVYAIGHVRERKSTRTLKVERIHRSELLMTERYEVPEDFDPSAALAGAWGIWASDEPGQQVVLRFSPAAGARVRENQWHVSEQTVTLPDGRLEWRAEVAEWREMLPWVRGWGAEVEVLAPDELRAEVASDAERLASLYGRG